MTNKLIYFLRLHFDLSVVYATLSSYSNFRYFQKKVSEREGLELVVKKVSVECLLHSSA